MSPPTQPTIGPAGPFEAASATLAEDFHTDPSEPGLGARHHLIRAGRGAPPPDVLEQIARADAERARLAADGELVRFRGGDGTEPLRIELCDLDGVLVRTLSPLEAIELAGGEPE